MAVSDDLPGPAIAGLSLAEIEGMLALAVRDFLDMAGYKVDAIELTRDARFAAPDFGPPAFVAHASLTGGPTA